MHSEQTNKGHQNRYIPRQFDGAPFAQQIDQAKSENLTRFSQSTIKKTIYIEDILYETDASQPLKK